MGSFFNLSDLLKGVVFMRKINVRGVAVSAIMGVVGFVLMCLDFALPAIIPSFIKLDFSELPALITAFAFGPVYGVLVCLVKNLLHLFITSSAGVGELSNFILGAVFTFTAGLVYKRKKTRGRALAGSLFGAAAMAAVSVVTNYFFVYPAYTVLYGMPREVIVKMYSAILPASDTLLKSLIIFNVPFTFFKGVADAVLCFAVYKRLSFILKGAKGKNNS